MSYAVVVPTVGRDTLADLLSSLAEGEGPPPDEVVIVNDRPERRLAVTAPPTLAGSVRVLAGAGRGPAAARNVGWRATHPVRPASAWVSLVRQRGNADDALLRCLYGREWRQRVGVPRGRRPWHAAVTASGAVALVALALGRRRLAGVAALAWLAATADFAARRIAPGPKTPKEVGTMIATSVLIPPVATLHCLRGWVAHRGAMPLSRAKEDGIR